MLRLYLPLSCTSYEIRAEDSALRSRLGMTTTMAGGEGVRSAGDDDRCDSDSDGPGQYREVLSAFVLRERRDGGARSGVYTPLQQAGALRFETLSEEDDGDGDADADRPIVCRSRLVWRGGGRYGTFGPPVRSPELPLQADANSSPSMEGRSISPLHRSVTRSRQPLSVDKNNPPTSGDAYSRTEGPRRSRVEPRRDLHKGARIVTGVAKVGREYGIFSLYLCGGARGPSISSLGEKNARAGGNQLHLYLASATDGSVYRLGLDAEDLYRVCRPEDETGLLETALRDEEDPRSSEELDWIAREEEEARRCLAHACAARAPETTGDGSVRAALPSSRTTEGDEGGDVDPSRASIFAADGDEEGGGWAESYGRTAQRLRLERAKVVKDIARRNGEIREARRSLALLLLQCCTWQSLPEGRQRHIEINGSKSGWQIAEAAIFADVLGDNQTLVSGAMTAIDVFSHQATYESLIRERARLLRPSATAHFALRLLHLYRGALDIVYLQGANGEAAPNDDNRQPGEATPSIPRRGRRNL